MPALPFIPRYQIEDYLRWEGDWELWNGVPVSMSPSPNFRHQRVASEIHGEIRAQLQHNPCDGDCRALFEIDWHVDSSTVVRPDILVICEDPAGNWIEKAPVLIVEILSSSTREKDLSAKKELYAREGVAFYLIADPEEETVQFLELTDSGYRQIPETNPLEISTDCVLKLDPKIFFA